MLLMIACPSGSLSSFQNNPLRSFFFFFLFLTLIVSVLFFVVYIFYTFSKTQSFASSSTHLFILEINTFFCFVVNWEGGISGCVSFYLSDDDIDMNSTDSGIRWSELWSHRPTIIYVSLNKLLNLSVPQFPSVKWEYSSNNFMELLWRLN